LRWRRLSGERELCFIKYHMRCDINSSSKIIKTQISLVAEGITKKDALNQLILQFMVVVRTNEGIT
jgi:hypothetical protein